MADSTEKPFTGPNTYRVWLNSSHPPQRLAQAAGEEPFPPFPEGYGHFASVRANGLQEVVARMTDMPSIFRDDYRQWEIDSGVQTFVPGVIVRDIEAGDVIVDPQGRAFRVEDGRFREVGTIDDRTEINYHLDQLQGIYETHGTFGLKNYPDDKVRLLLSAKELELYVLSERLEGHTGSRLDVMLKAQLEAQVRDLGGELVGRHNRLPSPSEIARDRSVYVPEQSHDHDQGKSR
jgi:hypothetical protein